MSLSSDALYRLQRARFSWASAAAGWAEQRAVGSSAVSRVCSTRGAALERVERPWETEGAPDDDGYPTSLAEPCRRLAAAADSLHEQLERLQAATDTLTALGRLEEARAGRGDSTAGAAPAVTTWDASRCAAAASRLLPLYTKETEVKRTVASWLAHADSAAALTALRAAWMHHNEVLATVIAEVEFMLNSRPLTYVSTDIGDPLALTPNHLLLGRDDPCLPPSLFSDESSNLRRRWKQAQQIAEHFWRRWSKEYLPTLMRREKWIRDTPPFAVGDVVLIAEDYAPRGRWPIARVSQLFPGPDGRVRSVELKTGSGTCVRPVVKLCRLEEAC
ncbi:cyclin-dependent kinase 2-interacting protein-like [Amphibalanus amphitrite]|uniref:cyclin-dependent kinase 2-interacting protein-like n=1 Tax=Amphibalanus amphitrite TaxID=1232801 RepID=UPI001C90590E|nr:cyclin-dependent kinase 2-interacting protein-like [Amphibalanus amphitrite]